jgi:predicted phosphodiesterase
MRLLQFSDIHFTKADEDDVFHLDRELQWGVRAVLLSLAPIDGILVCGDVAFSGQPSEYAMALKFLRDVCARLDVPPEMVFVIPGNHDIDRGLTDTNAQRALRASLRNTQDHEELNARLRAACVDQAKGALLLEPLEAYNNFASQYDCPTAATEPCWDHVLELDERHGLALRGVNSVLVSYQHDNESDERLIVGTGQCILEPESTNLYMTLCHHPPEWLLDGHALEVRFNKTVAVQVTGHVHKHDIQPTQRGILLRSGALQPSRREAGWDPRFAVIELELEEDETKVAVQAWKWDPEQVEFTPQVPDVHHVALPPATLDDEALGGIRAAGHRRRLRQQLSQLSVSDALLAAQAAAIPVTIADTVPEHGLPGALIRHASDKALLGALWEKVQDARGRPDGIENPF